MLVGVGFEVGGVEDDDVRGLGVGSSSAFCFAEGAVAIAHCPVFVDGAVALVSWHVRFSATGVEGGEHADEMDKLAVLLGGG